MPNHAPQLQGLSDVTVLENSANAAPQLLAPAVRFTDVEGAFAGGSLTVFGLLAEDRVSVRHMGDGAGLVGFDPGTGEVRYGGVVIGAASGGVAGLPFVVTFNAAATTAAIDALIQNLTYQTLSDTPVATRTLTLEVLDAEGATSRTSGFESWGIGTPSTGNYRSQPAFADLDGDGDLDGVAGDFFGALVALENTGTASQPLFGSYLDEALVDVVDELGFIDEGDLDPALIDVDADGDFDLVISGASGVRWFRNTGTPQQAHFSPTTAAENVFSTLPGRGVDFADIDGDGDFDALSGASPAGLRFFENVGAPGAPVFVERTGGANPLPQGGGAPDFRSFASPVAADIDGDGDLDLLIARYSDDGPYGYFREDAQGQPLWALSSVIVFENVGTRTAPSFVRRDGPPNPNAGYSENLYMATAADLDGDGDPEIVVSGEVFRNQISEWQIQVTVTPQPDPDSQTGTSGNDTLTGYIDTSTLSGLDGDDTLLGGTGDDILGGGNGNDTLDGGSGADAMTGGAGNDIYIVDNAGDQTVEIAAKGTDRVDSTITWTLAANVENLRLIGGGHVNGTGNALKNSIIGSTGNNTLYGLEGADALNGVQGNDILYGGAGVDTLNGGAGVDQLYGGADNDTYVVDNGGDIVSEAGGSGFDQVSSSVSFTLGEGLEQLTLIGAANVNGTGNDGVNTLIGNEANNTLSGGGANDVLQGAGGNDRLIGGAGFDVMRGGAGGDVFAIDQTSVPASSLGGTAQLDEIADLAWADGDRIDLSAIDAHIGLAGDQAFHFVTKFSGAGAEAIVVFLAVQNQTLVRLDVDGDKVIDYQLRVLGDARGGAILTEASPAGAGGWIL